ncbi:MAG: hypothetical protein ACD_5C00008G0006 [uncultured bacterium]|nr:MAG: hypothetical protein ACD_5C00008G0006 [uncultured bacterium]
MNKELIKVVVDSARTIVAIKNLNKTDKRIESADFYTGNAIHWLANFLSEVFYKLTLEEICEMAGLEFIEVKRSISFVARENNGSKEAFLLYNNWNSADNKGLITFNLDGSSLRENFRSVCLCNGCCSEKSVALFTDIAKNHGIKKIYTRIKCDGFEVDGVSFNEILEFPELSKITIPII